jgi:pantetheine-phosphate adenylyltransferase
MHTRYRSIGLGGTFDHFHSGHQHFLEFAATLADEVHIGLATTELTQHKIFNQTIQTFEERKITLTEFLDARGIKGHIFALSDTFGPALQPSFVEALAVTDFTKKGGEEINNARKQRKLSLLPIHVCDLVKDENGEFISSTRIRQGSIDRVGHVYLNDLLETIKLRREQKEQLKDKQGRIVLHPSAESIGSLLVGDIVLETFIQNQWPYKLGIYDQHTQRKSYSSLDLSKLNPNFQVKNEAGQMSAQLSQCLSQVIPSLWERSAQLPQHILVEGEEDLAAVSTILLAPLGCCVYYGQPTEGIVEVIVTEEIKKKLTHFLD